jgi:hypothetical protein
MPKSRPEQICPHYSSPLYRRVMKRIARRWMRRIWKPAPEIAPRRYEYEGYW